MRETAQQPTAGQLRSFHVVPHITNGFGGLTYLSLSVFRRKSHIFACNSVGWHLETNSFLQHVRLLMEVSPHTFFLKKYFDPMEECVFQ